MSQHVLYARPLVPSEERIKAAREKQMKQRALKEALDKQIEQMKTRNKQANDSLVKNSYEVEKKDIVQRYTLNYGENGLCRIVQHDDSDEPLGHVKERTVSPKRTTTIKPESTRNALASPRPEVRVMYNSNSLPPNFALAVSETNPLVPKRGEYETNSLPTGFSSSNVKQGSDINVVSTKGRDGFFHGTSLKYPSEVCDPVVDSEHQTGVALHGRAHGEVKKQLFSQQPQQSVSHGVPSAKGLASGLSSQFTRPNVTHNKHPGGLLPPLGKYDVANSGRISRDPTPEKKRLSGNPPLTSTGANAQSGGVAPQPRAKQPMLSRGRSNEVRGRQLPTTGNVNVNGNGSSAWSRNDPTRGAAQKVEQLQKELMTRDFEMAKMREKEKNWEEQVKRLKLELKSARKKERDLNKLVKEGPRRAETAPDQPVVSAPVLSSPSGSPGKKDAENGVSCTLGKRQKFLNNRIFRQENFRPTSAPSDTVTVSYVPEEQDDCIPEMQESFKLASLLTRKTTFGLHEERANRPVPIEYEHLLQFVSEQIITQEQADGLWRLFTNEEPPLALLHRQPVGTQLLEKNIVTTSNENLLNKKAEKYKEKTDFINKNEESIKEELSYIELEEIDESEGEKTESLDFDEENSSSEAEVKDTFDTSAELYLSECSYQEGEREDFS